MKTREFQTRELSQKLANYDYKEDRLNLLWTWIKQGVINRSQFKYLLLNCL
jgi:hypothetical protein